MELIGLKSLKMRLMKPLKEWMLMNESALTEIDKKKVFFSIQPFAKVFFSHNYALFSKLYSQRKDILKKDLIFPSGSKRHVPNVACIASIFL